MKVLYFMGHNPNNKSKVSWKLWKIQRRGRELTVSWGPATISNRRPIPANALQTKTWRFRTEDQAKDEERQRIQEKLSKGYKRMTRRRAR